MGTYLLCTALLGYGYGYDARFVSGHGYVSKTLADTGFVTLAVTGVSSSKKNKARLHKEATLYGF